MGLPAGARRVPGHGGGDRRRSAAVQNADHLAGIAHRAGRRAGLFIVAAQWDSRFTVKGLHNFGPGIKLLR